MAEDKDLLKIQAKTSEAIKTQAAAAESKQKAQKKIAETAKDITASTKELLNIESDLLDVGKQLSYTQLKRLELQRGILKDQLSSLQADKSKLLASAKNFKEVEKAAKKAKEIADLETEALPHRKKLLAAQKELNKFQNQYVKSIETSLGFVDKINEKIKSIPVVGDFLSNALGLDTIKDEIEKKIGDTLNNTFKKSAVEQKKAAETALKSYDSQINKLSGVAASSTEVVESTESIAAGTEAGAAGALSMSAALGMMIPIALAIAAAFELIKFAVDINKQTTELARNLGKSNKEARVLRKEMSDISVSSDNALMSIKNQTAAMEALATEAGTNKIISKDLIENQVVLTNNLGLTAEAAAKLNTTFVSMGKSVGGATDEIMETVVQTEKATGASINMKEVLTEISSVSAEVRGSFQGNVKALTLQVIKAKALGLTLDKIAEIGKQSLEIESSIGKEMEARVLTGKALDLNAFRLAALNKDQAGMQKELVKQTGSFAEFNNLNSIAQNSMAEAFGMTVSEMANMLQKGELMKKLNTDLTKISYDELANREDLTADEKERLKTMKLNADVTDKMAKAAESMKEIFAGMADALQPALDIFASMLKHTTAISTIIYGIGGYMAGQMLVSAGKLVAAFITQSIAAEATAAATTTTSIMSTMGAAAALIPIALAGVAALYGAFKSTGDLAMPASGGPIVANPREGTIFQGTANDEVAMAPGILGQLSNSNSAGKEISVNSVSADNSELVSLLKQLIAKVDQPVQIVVGNKVIDELDTHISLRKTYNTKVDHGYGVFG